MTLTRPQQPVFRQSRREFLGRAVIGAAGLVGGGNRLEGQTSPYSPLIVREREPENLEFPFASLNSFITPNELFYVRSHFAVPEINVSAYRLILGGAVEQTFELTYDELRKMPAATVTATL